MEGKERIKRFNVEVEQLKESELLGCNCNKPRYIDTKNTLRCVKCLEEHIQL